MLAFFAWMINSLRAFTFVGVFMVVAKLAGWPFVLLFGAPLGPWLSLIVIVVAIGGAMTTDQFLRPCWDSMGMQAWLLSARAA